MGRRIESSCERRPSRRFKCKAGGGRSIAEGKAPSVQRIFPFTAARIAEFAIPRHRDGSGKPNFVAENVEKIPLVFAS